MSNKAKAAQIPGSESSAPKCSFGFGHLVGWAESESSGHPQNIGDHLAAVCARNESWTASQILTTCGPPQIAVPGINSWEDYHGHEWWRSGTDCVGQVADVTRRGMAEVTMSKAHPAAWRAVCGQRDSSWARGQASTVKHVGYPRVLVAGVGPRKGGSGSGEPLRASDCKTDRHRNFQLDKWC